MAIVSVTRLFTDDEGHDTLDKHRTYSSVYEVISDDEADGVQQIGNAGMGLPALGDTYITDDEAPVVSLQVRRSADSPLIWYVTVGYDSDPPETTDSTQERPDQRVDFDGNPIPKELVENPLNQPATWTLTTQESEEPAQEGLKVKPDGTLVLPEAGAWFASTRYKRGEYRKNGGNVYLQTAGGTAYSGPGAGPAGNGTGIADSPAARAASTHYVVGTLVTSNGNVYKCVFEGDSGGVGAGPTEKKTGITDGTVKWDYVGVPAVWDFYATVAQIANNPNLAIRGGILNSAGLPFDPPIMVEVSRPVLSVTKNMPFATLEYLLTLKNAVNATPWRGLPSRTAKILKIEHDGGKAINGIAYVTTKWEIGLDGDTWDLRVLDAGFGRLTLRTSQATGEQTETFTRFVDPYGEPLDEPTLLDGAGEALQPGYAPVFLRFLPRQCRLIDFNLVLPF